MINEFIGKIKNEGLARTNRYIVTFGRPPGIGLVNTSFNNDAYTAGLFCTGAALPGMNIESSPHRIFSESREMPYAVSYNPLPLTFYTDTKLQLKRFFDEWMNLIIDPVTRSVSYYANYVTTISVKALNLNDEPEYEVELFEAWPKTVGEVSLSYESRDVMRLPVTFQYKNWKRKD